MAKFYGAGLRKERGPSKYLLNLLRDTGRINVYGDHLGISVIGMCPRAMWKEVRYTLPCARN